ncbi:MULTISPECIES: MFS transporter [unclassified Gilliamella]|uniref:MFS transporter n=1 Tax=unclassified Gilliamella TaxID=2685620 RepID=UPI00080E768C|nr:MFS transporter [Gilliamella apicola]OCG36867.1 permease [Gilliamella apicola]OCG50532.1 permease [Gilliamella apicola]OCG54432.1 permease [Gilliamella apicola]
MTEKNQDSSSVNSKADKKAWFGLITILALVLLVSMDGSVLYLAMPKITSSILPTADQSLWILDIYGFIVGSLLVVFGNIGDHYGRLRLIIFGSITFGVGSICAAFSSSPEMLIISRAIMGLGGATLLPSGLAILSNLFLNPKQLAQAIGIFAATFAGGFAIGPIIGGLLLSKFDWGVVFFINIPVIILFLIFSPIFLKEVKQVNYGKIDILSLVLSFAGILLFTYSIKNAAAYGISTLQITIGLIGIISLIWFVRRQNHIKYPLLNVSLFKDRVFSIAIATGLLSLVVWSASGYLTGIYLQSVLGFDVFTAALFALPGAFVLIITCIVTNKIADRIGKKNSLVMTHFFLSLGIAILLFTNIEHGVIAVIISSIIAGVGYGLSFSLVAEIAISAVPPANAGAAASLAETSNEIGNALGITILGSLAAFYFRVSGPNVAGTLNETLDYPNLSIALINQAKFAFVDGMHIAILVASALTFIVGILAICWIPKSISK